MNFEDFCSDENDDETENSFMIESQHSELESINGDFNEELFLKMICNYPAIYNPQNKGYSNKLLKENGFQNVARSLQISVEQCKKKWKSLREKYYREKQKTEILTRSGAGAPHMPQWHLMSFFNFMYDNAVPRETESSPIGIAQSSSSNSRKKSADVCPTFPGILQPSTSAQANTTYENTTSKKVLTQLSKRKKQDQSKQEESSVIQILGQISNSVEEVSKSDKHSDKLTTFANYICSELREFPVEKREEFIDQTVIRLLQAKRNLQT